MYTNEFLPWEKNKSFQLERAPILSEVTMNSNSYPSRVLSNSTVPTCRDTGGQIPRVRPVITWVKQINRQTHSKAVVLCSDFTERKEKSEPNSLTNQLL